MHSFCYKPCHKGLRHEPIQFIFLATLYAYKHFGKRIGEIVVHSVEDFLKPQV